MKTTKKMMTGCFKWILMIFLIAGCSDIQEIDIYKPDETGGPAPAITAMSPNGQYFSGFETITITGTNFSANQAENFVYFDGVSAQIVSATTTQLVVQTPNIQRNDIKVRVAVTSAANFSNTVNYNLVSLINRVGNFADFETPWAIAADAENNVYVSYTTSNNVPDGVVKISPDGVKTRYANPQTWRYTNMVFGPDGFLYAVRGNTPIVYRVAPGGGSFATHVSASGLGRNLYALTFDNDGNIWVAGNNEAIYRITPGRTVTAFPFNFNARAIKYSQGALYIAVTSGTAPATSDLIYRLALTNGTPGTPSVYFDVNQATSTNGIGVYAIESDVNGNLYLGTDRSGFSILKVGPSSWTNFYPGIVSPIVMNFAWGAGENMFITRGFTTSNRQDLFRVNMQTTKGI